MSTGIVVIVCLGMVLVFLLIAIRLSGDKKPLSIEPKPPEFRTVHLDGPVGDMDLKTLGLDVCPLCGQPVKGNK